MKTKKILNILFHNIFDENIIYVLAQYFTKKWRCNNSVMYQHKIKDSKKNKYYTRHYYYK
jgi:hypothetical protein